MDYGGVPTTDVFASFRAFCEAEGLAADTVRDQFLEHPESRALLARLETGKARETEFEADFAARLGVEAEGLIHRMFGHMQPDEAMIGRVLTARRAGLRTAMPSNSWGEDRYDRSQLEALFDTWVISGEVGVRKPDPADLRARGRADRPAGGGLRVRRRPARQPQAGPRARHGDRGPPRRRAGPRSPSSSSRSAWT